MRASKSLLMGGVALAAALVTACAQAAAPTMSVAPAAAPTSAPAEQPAAGFGGPASGATANQAASEGAAKAPGQSQIVDRLVIRNATINAVVKDPLTALQTIERLAETTGGFVVTSQTSRIDKDAMRADITIRVPAERLSDVLSQIRTLAVEPPTEQVSGQDVTEEYVDLNSKLKTLQATRDQLQKFMDEAKTTEDVLKVYDLLVAKQAEIDQVEGRKQYLEKASALSSVTVSLTPDIAAQPVVTEGWRPERIVRQALDALLSGLQGLGTVAIWLGIFILPVLAIVGIPLYLVIRLIRALERRQRGQNIAPAAPSTPQS